MFRKLFSDFPILVFFLLLGWVTFLLGDILKPFFFAIFWAVLLAAIFDPLNDRLRRKFKNRNLCAGLTLGAVLVTMILPVGLIIGLLIGQSLEIYNSIHSSSGSWMGTLTGFFNSLEQHPVLGRFNMDHQFMVDKSLELLKAVTNFLVSNLSTFTGNTVIFFVQFAVMIYCLFYFLRDGEDLIDTLSRYMPVDERHIKTFIDEFSTTSKATLKFTVVIGGIQGLLGGLVFYMTGIESSLVWGVLMVGLSIVPAIGNAIIWVPAGIMMLAMGHIWQGITILVFGAVVISSVDNLLRPILMGQDIQMHPLLIFLSTLGGIAVFGFSGFVLGPVVASFFLAGWKLLLELHEEQKIIQAAGPDR
ncbi:MAG: AI-2E family transporter [Syntrophaceae bacterium]|jgi:predicted PurR-regulated permease PerM|nr:AI-2E family transporter [Syntrophaceae bacterium]HOC59200.1 AI-2E family transporter [Smithellaceae bacterium]HQM45264.1 AI-2E family transporter [Smithellaceae bacterium]